MSRQLTLIIFVIISIFAIACLSCDDYNIVEPRFYDADDVVEIPMMEFADVWCAMVADSGGFATIRGNLIPESIKVEYSWCDQEGMVVVVVVTLPIYADVRLIALNSGGGISKTLVERRCQVGRFFVEWTPAHNGIYGLVLSVDEYRIGPIWVEVER